MSIKVRTFRGETVVPLGAPDQCYLLHFPGLCLLSLLVLIFEGLPPILCLIGSVTSPFHQSRLHWIHDPNPNQSHRVEPRKTVPRNNNIVQNSDSIPRNPLDPIPSASWYNSSYPVPSASPPRNSVHSHSRPVPRINKENNSGNEVSAIATRPSPPAPLPSGPTKKRRSRKRRVDRRAAEREVGNSSFLQDARWANQRAAVPAGATPHWRGGRQCTRLSGM